MPIFASLHWLGYYAEKHINFLKNSFKLLIILNHILKRPNFVKFDCMKSNVEKTLCKCVHRVLSYLIISQAAKNRLFF